MSWATKIHSMGLGKKNLNFCWKYMKQEEKKMLQQDFLSYLKQQISTIYRSGLHKMDSMKNAGKSTKHRQAAKKQATLNRNRTLRHFQILDLKCHP